MTYPTPSPWRWHAASTDQPNAGAIYRLEHPGHACAIAVRPRYTSDEHWAADAALIVEAVNAHQTLVEALRKIAAIKDNYDGSDWEEIEEARDIAGQALASIVSDAKTSG